VGAARGDRVALTSDAAFDLFYRIVPEQGL
jgi:hypothetical protein